MPHNVKVYGSAATHVHDSCGSGDPIFVHGLERTESWPAKETGEKRTKNVVVVDNRFGEANPIAESSGSWRRGSRSRMP
jgi:single-strand DNA-binding protein